MLCFAFRLWLMRPAELIAYAGLGIAGAFAAVIFAKAIGFFRPRLRAFRAGRNICSRPLPGF